MCRIAPPSRGRPWTHHVKCEATRRQPCLQARVDRAEAELARQRVLSEVGQAYLELRTSEQRVAAATAEEANARETVRLATGRYRVGLGIFLDVVDALSALLRAQTDRVNALTQLDLSRAALARAIGETPPVTPDVARPTVPGQEEPGEE
jgi:outer membrane protein TolC